MRQQMRDGSNPTNGHYRSVGNSQNLHDKIAINLPKNLNLEKENVSRTAN
jgi:hypothetical protein